MTGRETDTPPAPRELHPTSHTQTHTEIWSENDGILILQIVSWSWSNTGKYVFRLLSL